MDMIEEMSNSSPELLEAQTQVWNCTFNYINSMSLKCAVDLGIPDIIHSHGQPMTHLQIASALNIQPNKAHCVQRLMRLLLHSGFFAQKKVSKNEQEEEEESYVLTNASKLLLTKNPFCLKPLLLANLDPILTAPWHHLSTWFQNDDTTPFDTTYGMKFWEYAEKEPRLNNSFNEAMASDARLTTSVLISKCKHVFEGLHSLVDVGGGTGSVAKAIAEVFPQIQCTVFDLTRVVADLKSDIGNLKYVGGDMFKEVPHADAVLLKWILHNWNDEECVKILKKCKEAITNNGKVGKVMIIEIVMENQKVDDKSIETQHLFDLLMMVLVTGKQRDEKEWAKLFLEAGFSDYKISPILGLRSLIEVYP